MDARLSKKQIGQRITELRKTKGLSQKDLAKNIKISRPSLAQIELGNRGVNILELQSLSMVLGFSLDDFMSNDFLVSQHIESNVEAKSKNSTERIAVPTLQVNKLKNVLLYILEQCAGKPNVGETVLYKLLYFSDFNCYELYEEHLTGVTYRKLPYGPVPQKLDTIINQMLDNNQLKRIKTEHFDKLQTRYIPLKKSDLTVINGAEKAIIDGVLAQMSDWSATAISSYAHRDMPWMASQEGEEINYELVFYREAPFSVRNYGDEMEEQ